MINSDNIIKNATKIYHDAFIKNNYFENAILKYPLENYFDELSICNDKDVPLIESNIKIIISGHNQQLFPMELGDNPIDFIEFTVFEDNDMEDKQSVKEGRWIILNNIKYIVKKVIPSYFGSSIFLKDCMAQKER